MEIHVPRFSWLKLRGYVKVQKFHPEDTKQKAPLFHDEGDNVVDAWLLGKLVDHIDGTDSGSFSSNLIAGTSAWHATEHGLWTGSGYDTHSEDGKQGIFVDANAAVPSVGTTQAFYLQDNDTSSVVSPYTTRWIAEGTWNGSSNDGTGDSGEITTAYLGRDWEPPVYNATGGLGSYLMPFASFTVTDFTMNVADKVKITWDIAVDQ